MGMNQFVESIRRLYKDGKIDKQRVTLLRKDGKITEEEKAYILDGK